MRRVISSFRTRKFDCTVGTSALDNIHNYNESPTQVVLLAGEGFTEEVWDQYSKLLGSRGYSGFIFAPNQISLNTIDEVANALNTAIQSYKMSSPVLIGHSFSTLIAQRYLESFPASGLCMINPIPPRPLKVLSRIQASRMYRSHAVQGVHFLKAHYSLAISDSNMKRMMQHGLPHSFDSKLPAYVNNLFGTDMEINLEPDCCKVLSIFTDGDDLLDDKDIQYIANYYELDEDEKVMLKCESRAPMLDEKNISGMHDAIEDWIGSISSF